MTTLVRPTPSTYTSRGWIDGSHRGIDYGYLIADVDTSTRILAAAAGTVLDVYAGTGYNLGWGRRIRVDHGHGAITTYNHMRPGGVLVTPGQKVAADALIGRMGSSGAASGTHLHFELYLNGVRVNPQPYFTRDLPGTGSDSGTAAPAPSGSVGGQTFRVPAEGQYYYWQYQNALGGNYSPVQLLRGGQTLPVVENPGTGPVRVRAADGDLVWVGTRRNPAHVTGTAPSTPAPAKRRWVRLSEAWFGYATLADARAARNGIRWVPAGDHVIVEGTGPYLVYVGALGRNLWVGSRTLPPVIEK